MAINYAVEGEVRAACDAAGVLESAQADFIDEFRAGLFDRKGIEQWIEKRRSSPVESERRPNRWVISGTENDELFVDAFGPSPNYTRQSEVVKKFGEDRAKEIAAQFSTTLGGKPGIIPTTIKSAANGRDTNPFKNLRDPRTGQIIPAQMQKVESLLKAVGAAKCAAIAKSAGLRLDGTPIPEQYR